MKIQVKRFNLGGSLNALKGFAESDLGNTVGNFANNLDFGASGPGSGLSQEAATGNINNANATPQDLLQSDAGAGFRKAIETRKKGKAAYDATANAVAAIPVYGTLISGAMKLGKGVKDMFTEEDEYGITNGQYRRNPDLARTKETFALGKVNAAIADTDRLGATSAFNTPAFQAPAFGKFGMKFKRFR